MDFGDDLDSNNSFVHEEQDLYQQQQQQQQKTLSTVL
jgi:hypothetical protein